MEEQEGVVQEEGEEQEGVVQEEGEDQEGVVQEEGEEQEGVVQEGDEHLQTKATDNRGSKTFSNRNSAEYYTSDSYGLFICHLFMNTLPLPITHV